MKTVHTSIRLNNISTFPVGPFLDAESHNLGHMAAWEQVGDSLEKLLHGEADCQICSILSSYHK